MQVMAVHTEADNHAIFAWFNMNIGRFFGNAALHNGIDELDGRSGVGLFIFKSSLRALFHRTEAAGLAHLLHGAGCTFIFIEDIQRPVDGTRVSDHRDDALAGSIFHGLDGHEVHRILHRQIKRIAVQLHRNHALLLGDRLWHKVHHRRIDLCLVKVNEINTELHPQRFNQLSLRNEMLINQHRSETLARALLHRQCFAQLLFGDDAYVNQHFAQSFILHTSVPCRVLFISVILPCIRDTLTASVSSMHKTIRKKIKRQDILYTNTLPFCI